MKKSVPRILTVDDAVSMRPDDELDPHEAGYDGCRPLTAAKRSTG